MSPGFYRGGLYDLSRIIWDKYDNFIGESHISIKKEKCNQVTPVADEAFLVLITLQVV